MRILSGSHFYVRKAHSLTGVVPVGIFVTWHLYINSLSLRGPDAYDRLIRTMRSIPYLPIIEVAVIFLPLVLHAYYGLVITFEARNNLDRYPFARNWYFWFQRVTGLVTLAFIIYHVATMRLSGLLGAPAASFDRMAAQLSHPLILGFYVTGVVSATWHLANGLWLFGVNWGILVGPRAQRMAARLATLFFIILAVVGVNALRGFLL